MLPDPSRRKEALLRVLNRKFTRGSGSGPDRQGLTEARDLAQAFRSEGQSFYAGFIMGDAAVTAAWGSTEDVTACALEALRDFQRAAEGPPKVGWEAITALAWMRGTFGLELAGIGRTTLGQFVRQVQEELAQRLIERAPTTADPDAILVRGFAVRTDFEGGWQVDFPPYGPPPGTR
jgi:hypothetical protein